MSRSKNNGIVSYVLLWIVLAAVVLWIWKTQESPKSAEPPEESSAPAAAVVETETVKQKESKEMLGLWVPYFELAADDEESFKENYRNIAEKAKKAGVTALFVHVRPFCDALYNSEIFPTSHILGGEQGAEYSFDPLEYMLELTHSMGMEFHAWINPLRVTSKESPGDFSTDSIYSIHSESEPWYFIKTESGVYLDPAWSFVRQTVAAGAAEIAEKYEVDGIHFDDYFYPADMKNEDEAAYSSYIETALFPLSLEEWRMANINTMISETYRAVKKANPDVVFGISPQGNINNNAGLGADVKAWCSTLGYVDYICPQVYFSFENEALGFEECLDTWKSLPKHENLKLYIGLALYKVGTDSDGGTWSKDSSEIKEQIEAAKRAKTDGVICFDSSDINILLE